MYSSWLTKNRVKIEFKSSTTLAGYIRISFTQKPITLCIFNLDNLDTSKVWREKTFATAGDTCSTDERVYEGALDLAACKTKAEEYGNANFIYFQSATDRPAGIWCHIYTSCENTRASSLPGTNYYYGKFLMVDR